MPWRRQGAGAGDAARRANSKVGEDKHRIAPDITGKQGLNGAHGPDTAYGPQQPVKTPKGLLHWRSDGSTFVINDANDPLRYAEELAALGFEYRCDFSGPIHQGKPPKGR